MNINTSLFILCCFAVQQSFAQDNVFSGGAFFNVNGIEFEGDEAKFWGDSENKNIEGTVGMSAGLFVKRELPGNLSASMELRYIRKGSIYGFVSEYGTHAFETMCLDYAEIPVMVGYTIDSRKRNYTLESGPAFATLISSNLDYNHRLNLRGAEGANDFRKFDLSWIATFKFPVLIKRSNHFMVGLRVSHSIIPMHRYYRIYNFDYGAGIEYVFNH